MRQSGQGLFVLCVRCVGGVKLDGCLQCLLCILDVSKGELRLKQSLVNPCELRINSDARLAVFHGFSELLHGDEYGRPVGQNGLAGLDLKGLGVEADRALEILPLEGLIALVFLCFCLLICCCFYHRKLVV